MHINISIDTNLVLVCEYFFVNISQTLHTYRFFTLPTLMIKQLF